MEYKDEVSEDKFDSGVFNDKLVVNLCTEDTINVPNILKNPSTGDSFLFFILLILIGCGVSFIIFRKTKYTKLMVLIIGTAIIIPVSVYALCEMKITINLNPFEKLCNIWEN